MKVVFDAFYILFINHDLYVLLWYVFLIYKILMIEKQLLQIDLGFEGTNYWLEQKKKSKFDVSAASWSLAWFHDSIFPSWRNLKKIIIFLKDL